jgi:hypothetical protein
MNLSREIHKDLIDASLFHFLQICRESLLYTCQNSARLQAVWVEADFVRSNVLEGIIIICPLLLALLPRCNMLHDQIWAKLLCFGDRDVPVEAELSGRIVDGYQTLPKLLSYCCLRGRIEAYHCWTAKG